VRDTFPDKTIMAGNVVTGEMTEELILSGADIIKVGIGPGSVCTTRKKTGVGYPQLSAVIECADAAHGLKGLVCSDGGCTVPGDVAKAFGGGADFVMLGGMLSGHDECLGEIFEKEGKKFNQMLMKSITEKTEVCEQCGGMLNEEGSCDECGGGMYESKKKKLRLKESELVNLITKMVNESIPGLEAAKNSHKESGKENNAHLADVDKKMKDYLSFDGNDNPEFPKAIGKGDKVARKNTPEQEDEIKKNFAGLENLDYDIEPSEQFKKRLKIKSTRAQVSHLKTVLNL
jgi:IMP dehydrogenase/GMP reductase